MHWMDLCLIPYVMLFSFEKKGFSREYAESWNSCGFLES